VWDNLLLGVIVAFAAAAALVLATGHVSALVFDGGWPRFPAADTPGVVWRVVVDPGDPGRAWDPVNRGAAPPGPVAWWTTLACLAAPIVTPFAVYGARRQRRRCHGIDWGHGRRLRRVRVHSTGRGRLVVGRDGASLIAVEERHSLLVFGPTQSGKTTGLAIPAILEWPGPVVATSMKGDLVDHTIGWRTRLGEVHVFDPSASTRHRAAGWTPLASAGTWQGASRAAWDLAMAGKAAVGGGMSLADFWFSSAAKALAPYLFAAANSGRSITDVARWIDVEERDKVLTVLRRVHADAALAHQATFRREDRARSSLFQVMQQILGAYLDPAVARSAEQSDIDATELLDGGAATLYITSPYLEQERLRPLFATVVRQVIAAAYAQVARSGQPLDPPLLLVLDEAANIAPVDDLATIASTASGMGVQLVTVFQDLAQIRVRYGEATGTVVNNHRATLFLPGIKCVDTLELASRLIGEHEIDRDSITTGYDGRRSSTTTAAHWRRLLPAELARTMRDGSGVLIYGNLPPTRVRLRRWYRNHHLRRRAATEPDVLLPAPNGDRPPPPPPVSPPIRPPRAPAGGAAPDTPTAQRTPEMPLPPNVSILDVARERLRRRASGGDR
jgi:type IV secretion system protein VirD4